MAPDVTKASVEKKKSLKKTISSGSKTSNTKKKSAPYTPISLSGRPRFTHTSLSVRPWQTDDYDINDILNIIECDILKSRPAVPVMQPAPNSDSDSNSNSNSNSKR